MKRIILAVGIVICISSPGYASDAWAILKMISTQSIEHKQRLGQLRRQVEYLEKAAEGIDGVEFITDFRNMLVEGESYLNKIDGFIRSKTESSQEWQSIFGNNDPWIQDSSPLRENIQISDQINQDSYAIGDSFQELYQNNTAEINQLISNSRHVSEKGALKQISESLAHLLQMQNHLIYLMSQQLKQNSVEFSNKNKQRKEAEIILEEEKKGVRDYMNLIDKHSLDM